jgi:hypothetical protein
VEASAKQEITSELTDFVNEFRREAKKFSPSDFPPFPRGACNWACEILGHLLAQKGFGAWQLVKAEATCDGSGGKCTHDWLEKDGVVIDPTADQFTDRPHFKGQALPFIHEGTSPLSETFDEYERRPILAEEVHSSVQGAYRKIRTALGLNGR